MNDITILILEDEILLAEDLSLRLSRNLDYSPKIASNAESAKEILASIHVDFMIIDIDLNSHTDGIEFIHEVNLDNQIPFLFLTSHSGQGLIARAKKTNPSAYLLKPYNNRELVIAIDLALSNFSKKELGSSSGTDFEDCIMPINDSLFIKVEHSYKRLPFSDLIWLEADSNYTHLKAVNESYIYPLSLKYVSQALPQKKFVRIHRSYIINLEHLSGFDGNQALIGDKKLPISKSYRESFFRLIRTL